MNKFVQCLLFIFALPVCGMVYQSCCTRVQCVLVNGFNAAVIDLSDSLLLAENDSVYGLNLGIHFELNNTTFTCKEQSNFCFINSANAFSCGRGYYNYDTIESLHIVSDQPYDSTHAAGVNLDSIFAIQNDSINNQNYVREKKYFRPESLPVSVRKHQFRLIMKMRNSGTYEKILPAVTILN